MQTQPDAWVRRSYLDDVQDLAPRLRKADLDEIQAASGKTPDVALTQGFYGSSQCFTGMLFNKPICMFGITWTGPHDGAVWMLGSDDITKIPVSFCRIAKKVVDHFHKDCDLLYNCVDERNTVHIRWLKRLGFVFYKRHSTYGVEQRPFLEFARIK